MWDPETAAAVLKAVCPKPSVSGYAHRQGNMIWPVGAAGMMIWAMHTFHGANKLGMPYLP